MAEWYYIGHYGQLGPLTDDQIIELVEGGVVVQDTYVWKSGMANWAFASDVPDLRSTLQASAVFAPPPPPPSPGESRNALPPAASPPTIRQGLPTAAYTTYGNLPYVGPRSDRSRVLSGLLQIILPGVGRMYLGYYAIGVMQLVLVLCAGIGWLWSFIDGIVVLSGGVRFDGFGRVLSD